MLLRMLHDARRRGDRDEARRAWLTLVQAEVERVRAIVRAFRADGLPGSRIPESEIDDVVQEVFLRLHGKVDALRGESVGELRAFMRTAAGFACQDYLRRHITDDRRRAGSLDASVGEPSALGSDALDQVVARLAAADRAGEARALVHEALADVSPTYRAVLVMDQAGVPTDEIAQRLDLSRAAVYQRRRRGLLELREAIRERAEDDELR